MVLATCAWGVGGTKDGDEAQVDEDAFVAVAAGEEDQEEGDEGACCEVD